MVSGSGAPVIVASAAPRPTTRQRPVGRIGGVSGGAAPAAVPRLREALGAGARILDVDGPVVADWDACWLHGRPVESLGRWHAIVVTGRLGDVEGAFALAWREPDGALALARDALGERTLYWAAVPGGIAFASGVSALLATGLVDRALDPAALATYLSYAYVPGESTLLRDVREVLPAAVLRFANGVPVRERLWSIPAEPDPDAPVDEEALRLRLRERLERAVRRRLPAGEPVGAFLSGGVDSSLVVALARRLHDKPVHTYSVSFGPGHPNELAWSSLVAGHCGTEHRIVEISPGAVLSHLDATVGRLGDPNGDPLTVPNALLFREAADEVGVALNGEGGDPCFGGPKNLPMLLTEIFGDGANANADPLARERSYLRAHAKCYDDLAAMLAPDVRAALADEPLERRLTPRLADPGRRTLVGRLMALNVAFKGAHHILPKVDALSAPFGIVARSPLFDRAVVDAAFAIPPRLRLHGSVEKYLLKQAVRDVLPQAVVERPKSGMLVPVEGWFRGPLLPAARERLLDGLAPRGLVERRYLERLLAGRLGGLRPRRGAKIWLLLTLEAWLRALR